MQQLPQIPQDIMDPNIKEEQKKSITENNVLYFEKEVKAANGGEKEDDDDDEGTLDPPPRGTKVRSFFPDNIVKTPAIQQRVGELLIDDKGCKHMVWIAGLPIPGMDLKSLFETDCISRSNVFLTVPPDTVREEIEMDDDICLNTKIWNYMIMISNGKLVQIPEYILNNLCPKFLPFTSLPDPDKNRIKINERIVPILPPSIFLKRKAKKDARDKKKQQQSKTMNKATAVQDKSSYNAEDMDDLEESRKIAAELTAEKESSTMDDEINNAMASSDDDGEDDDDDDEEEEEDKPRKISVGKEDDDDDDDEAEETEGSDSEKKSAKKKPSIAVSATTLKNFTTESKVDAVTKESQTPTPTITSVSSLSLPTVLKPEETKAKEKKPKTKKDKDESSKEKKSKSKKDKDDSTKEKKSKSKKDKESDDEDSSTKKKETKTKKKKKEEDDEDDDSSKKTKKKKKADEDESSKKPKKASNKKKEEDGESKTKKASNKKKEDGSDSESKKKDKRKAEDSDAEPKKTKKQKKAEEKPKKAAATDDDDDDDDDDKIKFDEESEDWNMDSKALLVKTTMKDVFVEKIAKIKEEGGGEVPDPLKGLTEEGKKALREFLTNDIFWRPKNIRKTLQDKDPLKGKRKPAKNQDKIKIVNYLKGGDKDVTGFGNYMRVIYNHFPDIYGFPHHTDGTKKDQKKKEKKKDKELI